MILAPDWQGTQRLLRPDAIFVPLAVTYGVLLARSWSPDTLSLMMPGSFRQGFAGAQLHLAACLLPQREPRLDVISRLSCQP